MNTLSYESLNLLISAVAVALSIIGFLLNYWHSEKLFKAKTLPVIRTNLEVGNPAPIKSNTVTYEKVFLGLDLKPIESDQMLNIHVQNLSNNTIIHNCKITLKCSTGSQLKNALGLWKSLLYVPEDDIIEPREKKSIALEPIDQFLFYTRRDLLPQLQTPKRVSFAIRVFVEYNINVQNSSSYIHKDEFMVTGITKSVDQFGKPDKIDWSFF